MWFSSGGTKSVLHTDSYENINCLFSGSKRLWMAGPEHAHSINFDEPGGSFSKVIYCASLAFFLAFALFCPFALVCHYSMGRNAFTQSTTESSTSLDQPCRKVVCPMILLIRGSTGNCVVGLFQLLFQLSIPVCLPFFIFIWEQYITQQLSESHWIPWAHKSFNDLMHRAWPASSGLRVEDTNRCCYGIISPLQNPT